jgi:beta-D-xylosidase 4
MYSSHQYLALLWATGAYALFPDCTNGPLKNETICNPSACKHEILDVLAHN